MNKLLGLIRRKRVWIPLTLYVVYLLFGFLILPGILRDQIVKGIRVNMKREARLARVRVNPIFLSLTLEGFELKDPDGTSFLSFDRMFADYQVSSLVRWAPTLRVFELDGPRVNIRLMPGGKLNFDDMIPRGGGPTPRLVIGDFRIRAGSLSLANLMAPRGEQGTIAPIDLRLLNFTTIPQHEGEYRIAATDPGQGSWSWTGNLTFEPMHSSGVLEISGSRMRVLGQIVKNRLPFEITDGRFGCRFQYAVNVRGDSVLARVIRTSMSVTGFALRAKGVEPNLLKIDTLSVTGIQARYPEQTASIERVRIAGTRIKAWLNPDTTLNWLALFPPPPPVKSSTAAKPAPAPKAAPALPWTVTLSELAIRDFGLDFEDHTTKPVFAVAVSPVNATVRNITTRPGAVMNVEGDATIAERGRFEIAGTLIPQPVAADFTLRLEALPLPIFQPYVNPVAKVSLVSGTLGADGTLHYKEGGKVPDVSFKGNVESHGFLARDRIDNERFIAWKSIAVKSIDFTPKRLRIASVSMREPFAKVLVHKDRTTNIQDILGLPIDSTVAAAIAPKKKAKSKHGKKAPSQATASAAPAKSGPPPMSIRVGKVEVVEGSSDFADLSLILPFAARVEHLGGSVTGLSSDSLARADVTLDGQTQPSGTAQVRGQINPLADKTYVDLNVIFHDFNMPVLTPYTGQFIGREVDKGKMSLDLQYRLDGKHLVGENKVLLDQFTLGKKVESPEATHLPVGLAIAILKDGDGKIKLDVPVEGDVDDPKFRIWSVVWNFILSLLKKVALAPFALLGGLFGGGNTDQLSHIDFVAGTSTVPEDQTQSLTNLSEALGKRPALKLEVRGKADSVMDAVAIRRAKFTAIANEKMASDPKKYGGGLGYSTRLLEDLYVERMGKPGLEALRERFKTPAGQLDPKNPLYKEGSKKIVVNELGMGAAIQDTLVALQPTDSAELLALANARANAIKDTLAAKGVSAERIYVLAPEPGAVEKDRIRIDLNLTD